jgi:hypothetical protein
MSEIDKNEIAVVMRPTGLVNGEYTTISVGLMVHEDCVLDEDTYGRLFNAASLMASLFDLMDDYPQLVDMAVQRRNEIAQTDFLETNRLTPFSKTYGSA